MLRAQLGIQLRKSARTFSLRAAAIAGIVTIVGWVWVGSHGYPGYAAMRLSTSVLLLAIVAGGCFTGWRLAQFPKSRAAEFQLVTPSSDAKIVFSHAAVGWLRTMLILVAAVPLVGAAWGAGWITPSQLLAILAVPPLAGLLAGLLLAVVAYEPLWVRRLLERLVLVAILVYLFLFGLLGSYFVPKFYAWKDGLAESNVFDAAIAMEAWINPFRLMREIGGFPGESFALRAVAVASFLIVLILLCLWRLTCRLRGHYHEENFGAARDRKQANFVLGINPLSWWTARRVSRFKGNVNLYLAWATVGLYSCWLMYRDNWPAWLATAQLRLIEAAGGEAMLAAACFHLALVPTAFLAGLWDSNMQQRAGRLELLLATPLAARQFLTASLKAAWIRGRGYVLAALVMWVATAAAGRIPWTSCLALCLVALAYAAVSFAAAFAHFSKADSDKAVTSRGLAWAVFAPLVTVVLFLIGAGGWAAWTPLGALYILATPQSGWAAAYDVSPQQILMAAITQSAVCFGIAILVMRRAIDGFDHQIRASQWNRVVSTSA